MMLTKAILGSENRGGGSHDLDFEEPEREECPERRGGRYLVGQLGKKKNYDENSLGQPLKRP